jgi:PBP1b-binding outer membrane lipoprotein LpoB
MRFYISVTLIATALIFLGCSSKEEIKPEEPTTPTDTQDRYVDPELQGAPKWVLMPSVQGMISEVGSAPKNPGNDIGFQRNEAMGDARDNLARRISTKVGNMLKSYKEASGAGKDASFDRNVKTASKQIASQTLNGTTVHDTWISRSGRLYILMVIETPKAVEAVEESIKTSFKNDKALYQKFLAEKAQGELDLELERLGE